MWTQAHRATYRQSGAALPSDLTNAQWERLEPLIPAAKSGGRPRTTDMRAAMNAISISYARAVPGGICRAARFLRARRSTISSGSSGATGSGSASGKKFIWRCARRSTARPAPPPRSSTASR
jgi:hypothetical protein